MTLNIKAEDVEEALGLLKDAGLVSSAPNADPAVGVRAAIELLKVSALQEISRRLTVIEKIALE